MGNVMDKRDEQAQVYLRKGIKLYHLGKHREALEQYQQALQVYISTGNESKQADVRQNIGVLQGSLGNYEEAMKYYQQALQVYISTGNESDQADVRQNIGVVQDSLGNYEEAMKYYQQALQVYISTGNEFKQAGVRHNIGVVQQSLGNYEEAMKYYQQALQVYISTGNESDQADVRQNIGVVQQSLGNYEEAMEYYQQALQVYISTGNESKQARVRQGIGAVQRRLGNYEEAMKYYQQALQVFERTGNESDQAGVLQNIGVVQKCLGNYEEAMKYYQQALQVYISTGNESKQADVRLNIGGVQQRLGNYEEAMKYYQQELQVFERTGNESHQARVRHNIGAVQGSLGNYEEAMKYYQQALQVFQRTGNESDQADVLQNIGVVQECLGNYEEAMKYYQEALQVYVSTGNEINQATAYYNIGSMYRKKQNYLDAESHFTKSFEIFESCFTKIQSLPDSKITFVDTFIQVCQQLVDVSILLDKTEQALLVSERGRSRVLGDILLEKHGLQKTASRDKTSCDDLDSLTSYADSSLAVVSLTPQRLHMFALTTGQPLVVKSTSPEVMERAAPQFSGNVKTRIQEILKQLINDANKHVNENRDETFEDRSLDIGDASRRPHVSAGQERDGTESEMSCKATGVRGEPSENDEEEDASSSKESQASGGKSVSHFPPPHFKHDTGKPQEMEATSDDSEYQLPKLSPSKEDKGKPQEWEATSDDSECPSKKDTGKTQESPSGKVPQEHEEDIETLHQSNHTPSAPVATRFFDPLNVLYQILISPIEDQLTKPEVVFIPGGVTFMVPFGALKSPDGTFLAEKHCIRTGPSLKTLKLLKMCHEEKHCSSGALIVANPRSDAIVWSLKNEQWGLDSFNSVFQNLPMASKEAQEIGKVLSGVTSNVTCLVARQATKDAVMSRLKEGVGVIHIASHGDATTGKILVAPETRNPILVEEEDYLLTMKEVSACRINAKLVVLSCCHSGKGERIRAEGVMGLARAFLAAGALSVLATLWKISDEATQYFMLRFYRNLASGMTTSASLKKTIRDTIADNNRYSHPYYWGAFVLVGDDVRLY
ncbi:tetratricopeptide repeat protein 28 isoform X2 [Nematostella vectensis]|uniref:tetratricopeptide repeat protein 28 isoform X2 n=1 Tax=Nematostella vectensis TaxID=45351 RepID=UPI00207787E9|nr:tetratricopeptide repeat protein 28 isoform X2 [Nematostella vectensis]